MQVLRQIFGKKQIPKQRFFVEKEKWEINKRLYQIEYTHQRNGRLQLQHISQGKKLWEYTDIVSSRESNTPWRELKKSYPQEDMENRRADKDYATEMAIRTDFSKVKKEYIYNLSFQFSLEKSVPLDTVIRRAQYRPEYDFKALPHGQRFLMYTTYGPGTFLDLMVFFD